MNPLNLKVIVIECSPGVLARFPVAFAYLYGSQATGDAHKFSDVDIAVSFSKDTPSETIRLESDIALAFDEALDRRISFDVRSLNHMPLELQGRIVTEGILLYSCDEAARVGFESRTRMAYFDFRPVLESYRQAYIEEMRSE